MLWHYFLDYLTLKLWYYENLLFLAITGETKTVASLRRRITFITIFGIYLIEFIFPFNFNFYKIIHSRGSLSSNIASLFGVKFENIFISVSLKIDNCLWTISLFSITSHITDSMDFLIPSTFALLYSQTKRSYGGGYSLMRISLQ